MGSIVSLDKKKERQNKIDKNIEKIIDSFEKVQIEVKISQKESEKISEISKELLFFTICLMKTFPVSDERETIENLGISEKLFRHICRQIQDQIMQLQLLYNEFISGYSASKKVEDALFQLSEHFKTGLKYAIKKYSKMSEEYLDDSFLNGFLDEGYNDEDNKFMLDEKHKILLERSLKKKYGKLNIEDLEKELGSICEDLNKLELEIDLTAKDERAVEDIGFPAFVLMSSMMKILIKKTDSEIRQYFEISLRFSKYLSKVASSFLPQLEDLTFKFVYYYKTEEKYSDEDAIETTLDIMEAASLKMVDIYNDHYFDDDECECECESCEHEDDCLNKENSGLFLSESFSPVEMREKFESINKQLTKLQGSSKQFQNLLDSSYKVNKQDFARILKSMDEALQVLTALKSFTNDVISSYEDSHTVTTIFKNFIEKEGLSDKFFNSSIKQSSPKKRK